MADDADRARAALAAARRVVFFTGAGVSAESGLATFRDAGGLWEGVRPERVATPEAFRKDPAFVWEFYLARRVAAARAMPNSAHRAIAAYAAGREVSVVTQNVDGLHQAAGAARVLELHGTLWRTRCGTCGVRREDRREEIAPLPPPCACGGALRPDIVWFGEALPPDVFGAAVCAARACEICAVVGTSAAVWPAAGIPTEAARAGARILVVNAEETEHAREADWYFEGRAGEILPGLLGFERS